MHTVLLSRYIVTQPLYTVLLSKILSCSASVHSPTQQRPCYPVSVYSPAPTQCIQYLYTLLLLRRCHGTQHLSTQHNLTTQHLSTQHNLTNQQMLCYSAYALRTQSSCSADAAVLSTCTKKSSHCSSDAVLFMDPLPVLRVSYDIKPLGCRTTLGCHESPVVSVIQCPDLRVSYNLQSLGHHTMSSP